ncbi:hypothetical protein [Phaffia rhodozyma]|uniref:Uncharacterized protein n=1 Tax=Phaffia rhodozyma TaxID=264483 RepID=A0A0F7SR59_PHARH|nr:hypothetical protein [Phaffia rhodozyma]
MDYPLSINEVNAVTTSSTMTLDQLPFVVLDRLISVIDLSSQASGSSSSSDPNGKNRESLSYRRPRKVSKSISELAMTSRTFASLTSRLRFRSISLCSCPHGKKFWTWLMDHQEVWGMIQEITVTAGCDVTSLVGPQVEMFFGALPSLELVYYEPFERLSDWLAGMISQLPSLQSVVLINSGITSSPQLGLFQGLEQLTIYPGFVSPWSETTYRIEQSQPAVVLASAGRREEEESVETEETTGGTLVKRTPERRTLDSDAINRALAKSARTLKLLHLICPRDAPRLTAETIFTDPSLPTKTALKLPMLERLFIRPADLSTDLFPDLLLGCPRLRLLSITHMPMGPKSTLCIPENSLPKLEVLNLIVPEDSYTDSPGLYASAVNLIKGKTQLWKLELDVPFGLMERLFQRLEVPNGVKELTIGQWVDQKLLGLIDEKFPGLERLTFESGRWGLDMEDSIHLPLYLAHLRSLRSLHLDFPLSPTVLPLATINFFDEAAPFFHILPLIKSTSEEIQKQILPRMVPVVLGLFENSAELEEIVWSFGNTDWFWRMGTYDQLEMDLGFCLGRGRRVMGGSAIKTKTEWADGIRH